MSRLHGHNVVINWTDADIPVHIVDKTLEKENREPINQSQQPSSINLKRRKSVKTKEQNQTKSYEDKEKTQINDIQTQNRVINETNHFEIAANTNIKTSNNLLSQSNRMSFNEVFNLLKTHKHKYDKEIQDRSLNYEETYFKKWYLQMKFGFNILLHGVGSKKNFIERFIDAYLNSDYYLVLYGYHQDINFKNVIKSILLDILEMADIPRNFNDQIDAIRKHLQFPLYIIIHNIDGICLRDNEVQNWLSELATIDNIHYVASVDHINSALLWDHIQFISFKWVNYEINTFKPYDSEIMFENSLMLNQTGNVQLSSLIHVLKSLTQNAKNIFLTMVEHVLNDDNKKKNMPFSKLYYECREKFYVSNELTLRAQLTEFLDHKLIKLKTENDGVEAIYLLIDEHNLKLYLNDLKDKM